MSPAAQQIAALWLAAEQRKDAGEAPSVPGNLSAVFSLEMATGHDGASDRLAAKIAQRTSPY